MVHLTLFFSSAITFIRKNKGLTLILAFGILIVFAMFRYNFGNDYFGYYRNFLAIKSGADVFSREPLFQLFIKLCPNYYFFIIVTSIFTILPIYFLIRNYVVDGYQPIAVLIYCINPYLFLLSLSSIRQMLALSFFIIAINFSKKNQIIPYLIFIILAAMCHISAIILLPFYFIANDTKVSRTQVIVAITVVFVLLLANNIFDSILQYALDYFDNVNYNIYATQGGNTLRATLLSAIWFIYILTNIRKLNGSTLIFAKLSLFGYLFAILAYKVSMFGRLTMYFEIFSVISVPMIMYQNNVTGRDGNKLFFLVNKYIFPILMFTIYILRYYSFFTNPLWEPFYKYHTILFVR